ncbi:MAG: ribonuclease J [Candidatus Caenarcaniphilales bacterium]|nr:ribonuclease J [Candidatus Caenarcaniphilales bacterium]
MNNFKPNRPNGFRTRTDRPPSGGGNAGNGRYYGSGGGQGGYSTVRGSGRGPALAENQGGGSGEDSRGNRSTFLNPMQGGQNRPLPALSADAVRLIPLGGQGELGRSSWIFETTTEIILIDAGIGFAPQGLKGGVDFLLPNLDYLRENQAKIKSLVISCPCEEYAGNLTNMVRELEIKEVYISSILAELVAKDLPDTCQVIRLEPNQKYKLGTKFQLTAYPMSFTSVGNFAFLIQSGNCRILYTGPFKVDHTPPIHATRSDLSGLAQLGLTEEVDILLSCSSNIETQGYSQTESAVLKRFMEIFHQTEGSVFTLISSSHLQRLAALIEAAQASDRKICLMGQELKAWYEAASKLGYLKPPTDLLITEQELSIYPRDKVVVVIGTLEGHILQPFLEIAYRKHRTAQLEAGDVVVISGNPPLGTTRLIANAIDQLYVQGVKVIGGRDAGIQVSGYASQEELKLMYNLAHPKYFVPSQGEVRQLVLHAELLAKCGVDPRNVIILDNGHAIDFDKSRNLIEIVGKIPSSPVFFSSALKSSLNQQSIDERRLLGEDGTVTAVVAIDFANGKLVARPQLKTVGSAFCDLKEWDEMSANISADITMMVEKAMTHNQRDPGLIRRLIHDILNKRIREKFGMANPIYAIIVQEVK